jgi:hypothetical protein
MMRWLTFLILSIPIAQAVAQPVANFRLPDVNPGSIRFLQPVSPRDYVLQVSGYYFGDAG